MRDSVLLSPQRRRLVGFLAASPLLGAGLWLASRPARAAVPEVLVYKLADCGCCDGWADHMRRNGFKVSVRAERDLAPVRARLGVPDIFGTCHTAVLGAYVIEGHVPARDIQRMLAAKPTIAGLAVPGMPPGSPGMEAPRTIPYEVLAFTRSGATEVYARYR